MMGLTEQLRTCPGKTGIHPTSLCPHVEVHSEPWKLYSEQPSRCRRSGLFSSEGICSSLCILQERAEEFMSSLWVHALDTSQNWRHK